MQRNTLEIIMGVVVLGAALVFASFVYRAADLQTSNSYLIGAEFGSTGGLTIGDDVRLSGIKIGRITAQELDPVSYIARIDMHINNQVKLPTDSSARISARSLLGGNYLEILPGSDELMLAEGTIIYDTYDPVNLSDLLGKFVFQGNNGAQSQ